MMRDSKTLTAANTSPLPASPVAEGESQKMKIAGQTYRFMPKPIEIQAVQWTGSNIAAVQELFPSMTVGYLKDKGITPLTILVKKNGTFYYETEANFRENYELVGSMEAGGVEGKMGCEGCGEPVYLTRGFGYSHCDTTLNVGCDARPKPSHPSVPKSAPSPDKWDALRRAAENLIAEQVPGLNVPGSAIDEFEANATPEAILELLSELRGMERGVEGQVVMMCDEHGFPNCGLCNEDNPIQAYINGIRKELVSVVNHFALTGNAQGRDASDDCLAAFDDYLNEHPLATLSVTEGEK